MIVVNYRYRRCGRCGEFKPYQVFRMVNRWLASGDAKRVRDAYCRDCRRALNRDRYYSRSPEQIERDRARNHDRWLRLREDPAWRARNAEWQRNYYARLPAKRKRETQENARIRARLWREQRHLPVRAQFSREEWVGIGKALYLPPDPLIAFCVEHGGPAAASRGSETLQRALRRLVEGETAHAELGVADALCVKHGLLLHDFYPVEQYPEVFA